MDPKQLYEKIKKGDIAPLYYLYGEERYLIDELLKRLRKAILPEGLSDFNHDIFYAGDSSPGDVLAAVETLPMMSSHRLVEVREVDAYSAKEREKLFPIVESPVESTVVVFVAETGDQRSKFLKKAKKSGLVVQFKHPYDDQLPRWIHYVAKQLKKRVDEPSVQFLMKTVGSNLLDIYNELSKAAAYVGEKKEISVEDLEETASPLRETTVFELTRAIGMREPSVALKALNRLLGYGEPGLLILSMIIRQWRLLWRAKGMLEQGTPPAVVGERLKIHPYFRQEFFDQCRRNNLSSLREKYSLLNQADLGLKLSAQEKRLILEDLVLQLCSENVKNGDYALI
ncbi:DNA polymerase III subunit delta [Bdellovibrionota bacterium]